MLHFLLPFSFLTLDLYFEIWVGKMADIREMLNDFILQSQRVLNVTHKPGAVEFKQIAVSTAVGIAIVGGIGFLVHGLANLLKGL